MAERIEAALFEPNPTNVVSAALRWLENRDRKIEHRGELSLRDGDVLVGDRAVCTRAEIENAVIVEDSEVGTLLRLHCTNRVLDLGIAAGLARDARERLELDPAHQLLRIADIAIGADGIYDGSQVISLDEVAQVRIVEDARSDELSAVELRDANDWFRGELRVSNAVAESVAEGVRSALAVRPKWRARVDRSVLARNDRDEHEWVRGLRELLSVEGTYRHSSLDADSLAAVVRDPEAPLLDRAAAAVATARARPDVVSAAATATAHPKLRKALHAALDDDDALVRALRRLGER